MLSVKVSSKYQIVVPSAVRSRLGVKSGDFLDVEIEGDVIHLRRHQPAGERLRGIGAHLWDGTDPADRISRMRDEDEAELLRRERALAREIAESRRQRGNREAGTGSVEP